MLRTHHNSNPEKIAICLEYPIGLGGGVSVLVCELAESLAVNYCIYLISNDSQESLAANRASAFISGHFPWNPGDENSAVRKSALCAWLKENEISLVHLHCGGVYSWGYRNLYFSVPAICSRAGFPILWTNHSVVDIWGGYCGPHKPKWFKALLLPFAWGCKLAMMRCMCAEIAVSKHDFTKLKRRFFPFSHKLRQIYHSKLSAKDPPPRPHQREEMILNVGHIAFRKGQHILAEAFANLAPKFPSWRLELVGHDAGDGCWQAIEKIRQANGMGDRICLHGQREDTEAFMQSAGIYVQPSLEEALGLALQESLFHGCPSIGTKIGGIPELIEETRTGFLVEANSSTAIAEKIEFLIKNSDVRDSFSSQGRRSILEKNMTSEAMAEAHRTLYQSILNQKYEK